MQGETPLPAGEAREVLWWGEGIKGIAEASYPHPLGWTFEELKQGTTIDMVDVKQLTAAAAFRLAHDP